jgi:hypothetical protein
MRTWVGMAVAAALAMVAGQAAAEVVTFSYIG